MENTASSFSYIVACVLFAEDTCLTSRYLATSVSSGCTNPFFELQCHNTKDIEEQKNGSERNVSTGRREMKEGGEEWRLEEQIGEMGTVG
jgi:hypothetical protein